MKQPVSSRIIRFRNRLIIWDKSYTVVVVIVVVIFVASQLIENGREWMLAVGDLFTRHDELPAGDEEDEFSERGYISDENKLSVCLFEGALDSMFSRIDTVNWNALAVEWDTGYLSHQLFYVHEMPVLRMDQRHILAFVHSNAGGNYCHGCQGFISMFEMKCSRGFWNLTDAQICFGYGNFEGEPPSETEIIEIGSNGRWGVFISIDWEGASTRQHKILYTLIGDSLKPVFDYESYYHYEDYLTSAETEVFSVMTLVRKKSGYYDIVLHSSGKSEDVTLPEETKYVFNGSAYDAVLPLKTIPL